jgi:hypothetical protein
VLRAGLIGLAFEAIWGGVEIMISALSSAAT